jgi:hypothetical protein
MTETDKPCQQVNACANRELVHTRALLHTSRQHARRVRVVSRLEQGVGAAQLRPCWNPQSWGTLREHCCFSLTRAFWTESMNLATACCGDSPAFMVGE